jgi:hypothetical protein
MRQLCVAADYKAETARTSCNKSVRSQQDSELEPLPTSIKLIAFAAAAPLIQLFPQTTLWEASSLLRADRGSWSRPLRSEQIPLPCSA